MPLLLLLRDWLSGDYTKILLFVFVACAVLVITRWSSRASERAADHIHDFGDSGALAQQVDVSVPDVHPTMRFDDIELRKFYFGDFNALSGPPDPFEFASELTAEVEHLRTGDRSTWEFTVGTPAGFARLLEKSNWESFYSPQVFVIRKYEVELVREMVVDHIRQELDTKPGSSQLPEPPLV